MTEARESYHPTQPDPDDRYDAGEDWPGPVEKIDPTLIRMARAMQDIRRIMDSLPDDDQATVAAWYANRYGQCLPF